MNVSITWTNNNPNTIYNKLAAKLGREPSSVEVRAELDRIFEECAIERAGKGKLKCQR